MATEIITAQRLRELLDYDPETGVFTYRAPRKRIRVGERAGGIAADGYRVLQLDKRKYRCARLAWLYVHGEWPQHQVDHIDGNGLNDAIANLRDVEPQTNAQNKRAAKNNKTGYLGVYKNGNGMMAQATVNGKPVYLGTYRTAQEASQVATAVRRALYAGFLK